MQISVSLFAAVFALPLAAISKVIYVNGRDGDLTWSAPTGDGTSWQNAYTTLRYALADAESGDELWLAEGNYFLGEGDEYLSTDRTLSFVVPAGVSIYGGFDGTETTRAEADPQSNVTRISGIIFPDEGAYHVFTCGDNVLLSGIQILSGKADGSSTNGEAAAISLTDPNNRITLERVRIADNTANRGAVSAGGVWTLTNCVIEDNQAFGNGGVAYGGTWTASNTTFSYNQAYSGGVFCNAGWSVDNCLFEYNEAFGADGTINWPNGSEGLGGVAMSFLVNTPNTGNASKTVFRFNGADVGGIAGIPQLGNDPSAGNDYLDTLTINAIDCLFLDNFAFSAGVGYSATWNMIQCVFCDNDGIGSAGVAIGGAWTVNLCTFSANGIGFNEPRLGRTATEDAYDYSKWTIINSVFADEEFVPVHNLYLVDPINPTKLAKVLISEDTYNRNSGVFSLLENYYESLDADPDTPGAQSYFPDGTTLSDSVIVDAAPSLFLNEEDPDGPDNIWGTQDDGLRLRAGSPGIEATTPDYIPINWASAYEGEPLINDFSGLYRVITDYTSYPYPEKRLDLGAYEGEPITVTLATNLEGATTTPNGTLNWIAHLMIENARALLVDSNSPMAFSNWSVSPENMAELSYPDSFVTDIIPFQSITVTANYAPDSDDDDGDGLTNYEEIVIHGTSKSLADTSGDGIRDKVAIDSGLDPTKAHTALVAEVRRGLVDLRAGSSLITKDAQGKLQIQLQIERSSDLINWTADPNDTVTKEIVPAGNAQFFRFGID